MALLLDRNANTLAHDYATPPYRLTAVYIVYATGPTGTTLKVGATQVQSKDLTDVLRGVQRRVRLAVPCAGPRRNPTRPTTFVWVVLSTTPVLRHELEQALVERFGDRRFDPLGTRRREFCDPGSFGGVMEVVDHWRERFPDALSESLWSEDAGASYVAPRVLLPYGGATAGLWVEPPREDTVALSVQQQRVPSWVRHEASARVVAERPRHADVLMNGHHTSRVERLLRGLRESPAVASANGHAYRVLLGH